MARKFYTKEQAAEMLVLSDDDSDIDNDPISDESDSGDDIPLQEAPPTQHPTSVTISARPSEIWTLVDTDSDLILPNFAFLGVPGLKSESEEVMQSTTDDYEIVTKSF